MSVIRIERTEPRDGIAEFPVRNGKGYALGDPRHGDEKHLAANKAYVEILDDVAERVEAGFSLWMGRRGKRASLICPTSLCIERS